VNEQEQQLNSEPPNLTELKEMFQQVRKEYVRQKNNPQLSQTAQKQHEKLPGKTQHTTHSTPEGLRGTPGDNKRLSPGTFELTNTEPRQTYEQSRAKLDPRQALFDSRENTYQGMNDDVQEHDLIEVESQEELSQKLESEPEDDLIEEDPEVRDSNYQVYEQLQKELEAARQMYKDLQMENNSLKSTQEKLEKQTKEKKPQKNDNIKIEEDKPGPEVSNETKHFVRKREDYLGVSSVN